MSKQQMREKLKEIADDLQGESKWCWEYVVGWQNDILRELVEAMPEKEEATVVQVHLHDSAGKNLAMCGLFNQLTSILPSSVTCPRCLAKMQSGTAGAEKNAPPAESLATERQRYSCPVSFPHPPHDNCDGNPDAPAFGSMLTPAKPQPATAEGRTRGQIAEKQWMKSADTMAFIVDSELSRQRRELVKEIAGRLLSEMTDSELRAHPSKASAYRDAARIVESFAEPAAQESVK